MGITKPELIKYLKTRMRKGNCPLSIFGKEFNFFLIATFKFSVPHLVSFF